MTDVEDIVPIYQVDDPQVPLPVLGAYDESGDYHSYHAWPPDFRIRRMDTGGGELGEGMYFAKGPARADDVYVALLDFGVRFSLHLGTSHWVYAIRNDLLNLAEVFFRLELYQQQEEVGEFRRSVICDIEYLFWTCRSLFDCVQQISKRIWANVELLAEDATKRELPDSFARMIEVGGNRASAEQLIEKYAITESLAHNYVAAGDHFLSMRSARNKVDHQGVDASIIFCLDQGFASTRSCPVIGTYPGWHDDDAWPENQNGLFSVRQALAELVVRTLETLDGVLTGLLEGIMYASAVRTDFHAYLRGPHSGYLNRLEEYRTTPWIAPD